LTGARIVNRSHFDPVNNRKTQTFRTVQLYFTWLVWSSEAYFLAEAGRQWQAVLDQVKIQHRFAFEDLRGAFLSNLRSRLPWM
jgi:hypothetical protein